MYYGYHRVSTKEQNIDRGIEGIKAFCKNHNYPLHKVFIDKISGKDKILYNHLVYSYDNWEHYIYCGDSDEIEVPYKGQPLKGAIWTHDGLKYVIERTKEGKWRLIWSKWFTKKDMKMISQMKF